MKTYYEIIQKKSYRQLTAEEKELIQSRQTDLVISFQDAESESTRTALFDELFDSFRALISAMAYKQTMKSYTVEREDFVGMLHEELWKTVLKYDRSVGVPFAPVFIMNFRNAVKMMYRQKSYDLHESTTDPLSRLDSPCPEDPDVTMGDALDTGTDPINDLVHSLSVDQVIEDAFGPDLKKKTIVHMFLEGFKRNEIVAAVKEDKSVEATARLVNRTVSRFRDVFTGSIVSRPMRL